MEAVARGVQEGGGLCVGSPPGRGLRKPIPTSPFPSLNRQGAHVLIAQSCAALVAVGGQYGTLSEIAFGLHFDKPVFGLADAPDLPDIRKAESVEEVCRRLADYLLQFGRRVIKLTYSRGI